MAREEPQDSFNYERLELISAPKVPALQEVGYLPKDETFVARAGTEDVRDGKIEVIGKKFFGDIIEAHFSK